MGLIDMLHGYVDAAFESLSGLIGTPPDQLKVRGITYATIEEHYDLLAIAQPQVIAILVFSIPLALPISKLPPSSSLTHIYSIVLAWIYHTQILHLPSGFYQLLGQSIGTYYASSYCFATRKSKAWYWAIFAGNMGILTLNHFTRWIDTTPLDIIEITGSQMVLVMKLSLFSWSCYDGARPAEQLDTVQKRDRLTQMPGLLPFLGYW